MSFSRSTASTIVPLLSRVVLAAAFIPAGWDKIMGEPIFYVGAEAAILTRLGVGEPASEAVTEAGQSPVYQDGVQTGRLRDRIRPRTIEPDGDEVAGPIAPPPPPPRPVLPPIPQPVPELEPEPEPIVTPPPPPPPPVVDPKPRNQQVDAGTTAVKARPLYKVAIMLVENTPYPEKFKPGWAAWAAAGVELGGGALILIGLVSRVWGLGLATIMGVAFYLTSMGVIVQYRVMQPLPLAEFNQVFTQIALFALAMSIALTGAGRLSIDGLIFRRGDDDEDHMLNLG